MSLPIMYAMGHFVADLPWFIMILVPFWGSERINKKIIVVAAVALILSRAAMGGLIFAFVPDWEIWDNCYLLFHTCLLLAAFYMFFKTSFPKLLYTLMLILILATSANCLAHALVQPFLPTTGLVLVAEPSWIIAVALVAACSLPFVYRIFKGLLRSAFAELPQKTIWFLCIPLAMVFIVIVIFAMLSSDAFQDIILSLLVVLSGVVLSFVTLRVVVDTAGYMSKERQLTQENAALDRVNILKTELMRTISHEMRTPLAIIRGFAELTAESARKDGMSGELLENLDAIAFEAARMADMTEEMRQLALAKEYPKDKRPVNMETVIRQITGLYTILLEQKGTALELRVESGEWTGKERRAERRKVEKERRVNSPFMVLGNENELTQVMFNLIRNAELHTQNGKITITLDRKQDDSGYFVRVSVRDTGAGIPPELLPHVFERGVHGQKDGSGYGLPISRDIITAYGGEIWIESEHGRGTTAIFTLPPYTGERGAADE